MPICPHCGAEVQPEDIFCGNCGGDLTETVGNEKALPPEPREESEEVEVPPPAEEERIGGGLPSPSEAFLKARTPDWMSPTSRTLWIIVVVVLLMLLCCCGILGVIALARVLSQGPVLPPQPLL